jgi:hypothetical protein
MKKLIPFLFLMIPVLSFGQERVNKSLPSINKQQINWQLNTATGWILNPEGQWVSRSNRIPVSMENQYKSLIDYEKYGLGKDNFISYQIREISIQDSVHYIFIQRYKDGDYEYPAIERGWYNYNSALFFVFRKNELHRFNNFMYDSINIIEIPALCSGRIFHINSNTYLSDIEKEIVKLIGGSDNMKYYLVFNLASYKSKNIMQFLISTYYMYSYKDYSRKQEVGVSGGSLETFYYETTHASFEALFKLAK